MTATQKLVFNKPDGIPRAVLKARAFRRRRDVAHFFAAKKIPETIKITVTGELHQNLVNLLSPHFKNLALTSGI